MQNRTAVGSREKPGGGFELWSWFFMRISGIFIIFLVLGHLLIMHLIYGIEQIDYDFVVNRLRSPVWKTYDALLLGLALLHGANGMRILIDDYIHSKGWLFFWYTFLFMVTVIIFLMGLQILLTFPK
ncbi:MAG: succinate dehydrogenase, hydrophobic membrane anchor protein [bacterium]